MPIAGHSTCFSFITTPKGRRVRQAALRSVPPPDDVPAPPHLLLYHGQAAQQALARHHVAAQRAGHDLHPVQVTVDVGRSVVEFLTPDDLQQTGMMNVARVGAAVRDMIVAYWRGYLRAEGCSDAWLDAQVEWRAHRYLATRPDLLARLVTEPEFAHLRLVAFDWIEQGRPCRVALVPDRGAIVAAWCPTLALPVAIAPPR